MDKTITLSHQGLSRLGREKDFELKTNNKEDVIKCSRSQIAFFSPIIANLLLYDPTMSEFSLETEDSSTCSEIMRSLLNGDPAIVKDEQLITFYTICAELGNDELLTFPGEYLTLENAIEIADIKYKRSESFDKEAEFIASHFNQFDEETISSLDVDIIDCVLSCKSLVIKSEHSMFTFICDLIKSRGDEYKCLLAHLAIEYLDDYDISKFIDFIDDDCVGCLLPCIYRRLVFSAKIDGREDKKDGQKIQRIEYKFDGIFSSLWKEFDENPVSKGIVDITDSKYNSLPTMSYLVDPEKRNQTNWYCYVGPNDDSSIIIDFKDKMVSLTGYSLKAHSRVYYSLGFMKEWRIEGSNDKEEWSLVDEQRSQTLRSCFAEGYWKCPESQPFRFFRIMMTAKNSNGLYGFALHAIEFFGSIIG